MKLGIGNRFTPGHKLVSAGKGQIKITFWLIEINKRIIVQKVIDKIEKRQYSGLYKKYQLLEKGGGLYDNYAFYTQR